MNALDVVTLPQAKLFLRVDFSADDDLITDIIKSAVDYVEQTTNYRLYIRTETLHSDGRYNVDIFQTPCISVKVQTIDGTEVTQFPVKIEPVRRTVQFVWASYGNAWSSNNGFGDGLDNGVGFFPSYASSLPLYKILVECGYATANLIPNAILQSVKTIITNMYENRDLTADSVPSNVTDQLQSYNLNPMF